MRRYGLCFLILVTIAFLTSGGVSKASAQEPIVVSSESVENDFPRGLDFAIEISSAHPVKEVELRFFLGTGRIVRLAKPELLKGVDTTNGSYFLRLTGNDYQPPGVVFNYWYVIEDVEGNVLETPRKTFPYLDNRFNWKELTEGPITVLYYGPVKSRAESVLQASVETNQRMGKTLELELETPLRVMMYNNVKDMIDVIPFTSNLIRRTLITEGQAYANQGLMFVLGSDPLFRGVTSHEFTHILVGNATSPHTGLVPVWLTEGLAEYGNLEPGPSYGEALEKGIRTRTLFSVTELTGRPGTPDEIILLYGQSKSLVEFLVTTYSPKKIAELLRTIRSGNAIDTALQKVYGFDRRGLEERWRQAIGAAPATPARQAPSLAPTPPPVPTLVPLGAEAPAPPTPSVAPTPTTPPEVSEEEATPRNGGGGCGLGQRADGAFAVMGLLWVAGGGFQFWRRRR